MHTCQMKKKPICFVGGFSSFSVSSSSICVYQMDSSCLTKQKTKHDAIQSSSVSLLSKVVANGFCFTAEEKSGEEFRGSSTRIQCATSVQLQVLPSLQLVFQAVTRFLSFPRFCVVSPICKDWFNLVSHSASTRYGHRSARIEF